MAKKKAKKKVKAKPVKKAKQKSVKKAAKISVKETKINSPNMLKQCKEKVAFVLNDGRKLKSIIHLIDELENMPDDVFSQHVNEYKNDFSNWIKDVFKDDVLADELQLVNDRLETQRALLKHAVRYFLEVKK